MARGGETEADACSRPGPRPSWLSGEAVSADHELLVTGRGEGAAFAEAERAARSEAEEEIAGYVRTVVEGKFMSRLSGDQTRVSSRVRSVSRGRVEGAMLRGEYCERQGGFRFFGKPSYAVWVRLAYPLEAAGRERVRLEGLKEAFEAKMRELCRPLAAWLKRRRPGQAALIGGFREESTRRDYPFGGVVEGELRSCLAAAGVRVAGESAGLMVSGAYVLIGEDVSIKASVERAKDGELLFGASTVIPADAIEPQWLRLEGPGGEEFSGWSAGEDAPSPRGLLSARSTPPGARVYLDGKDVGVAPAEFGRIAPGVHAVAFELDGYEIYGTRLRVLPGEMATAEATLRLKTGRAAIESVPAGADVLIDGAPTGRTPAEATLKIGPHELILRKRNFREIKSRFVVAYGETVRLSERLTEDPGSVSVISSPAGAEASFDGGDVSGKTPLRLDPFPAGRHAVKISKRGYAPWRGEFTVRPHEWAQVSADLKPGEDEEEEAPPSPPRDPWYGLRFQQLPDDWWYADAFGAYAGAGFSPKGSAGAIGEMHLFKFLYYVRTPLGGLGGGTSLMDMYFPTQNAAMSSVTTDDVTGGAVASAPSTFHAAVETLFPVEIAFAPWSEESDGGIESFQFFGAFSAWSGTLNDKPGTSDYAPSDGMVLDAGAEWRWSRWFGIRAGYLALSHPGFSYSAPGGTPDACGTDGCTTRYAAGSFSTRALYAALEFDLCWQKRAGGGL